jgi:hypothetical protein
MVSPTPCRMAAYPKRGGHPNQASDPPTITRQEPFTGAPGTGYTAPHLKHIRRLQGVPGRGRF